MNCRFLSLVSAVFIICSVAQARTVNLEDFGFSPNPKKNASVTICTAINKAIATQAPGESLEIIIPKATYNFRPVDSNRRVLYISNHDQDNPKFVGLPLDYLKNVTLDFSGSNLLFHGRMLPISMTGCENCSLKNFSIDFPNPQIAQVEIVENDIINKTITYRPAPWVKYDVTTSGDFVVKGEGWSHVPSAGIAFDGTTKHLVYRTSDINVGTHNVTRLDGNILRAPWDDARLIPGTVLAMRDYGRPCPGIAIADCINTSISNAKIHYAEGMGLIAQMSENITLENFSVCLRGESDPRYFTTNADATHFSGCRGKIISRGGLYEGMMDDAINVHGTYLKVIQRLDSASVIAQYCHNQTYGFRWGEPGDTVQWIKSQTMDVVGNPSIIKYIQPWERKEIQGAKQFRIVFAERIPDVVNPESETFGIENLTWSPEVEFSSNTIRNNRARGALFSTPRRVVVENNLFDHTSGCAILLCGDCNGWFETGACHDVTVRNNRFVNALTNMFQFTNAVISIYPVIPQLSSQSGYFHSNIRIVDNFFETFDKPLLYAKSVDGLIFLNNKVITNSDYEPFHWNNFPILLERVTDAKLQ